MAQVSFQVPPERLDQIEDLKPMMANIQGWSEVCGYEIQRARDLQEEINRQTEVDRQHELSGRRVEAEPSHFCQNPNGLPESRFKERSSLYRK